MTTKAEENKEIAIKFFEALSSGSETYLDFYNDDSIIWTAGDNAIGGTRTKKEIITFAKGILEAFPNGIEFKIITEDELGIKQHGRGTGRVSSKRHPKNRRSH